MYPGPEPRTPVNKFRIRDRAMFEAHEARVVAVRARNIPNNAKELTYKGFKALHKHLFQDVFEWAGKERTYTTGRNAGVAFAKPEHIASFVEKEFKKFEAQGRFVGMDADAFATAAANFYSELNAAHPFIEGNGRTMRLFLQMVADNADFKLDLRDEDKEAWNEAAKISFLPPCDLGPLTNLIRRRISYLMPLTLASNEKPDVIHQSENAKRLNGDLSPSYVKAEFKRRLERLNTPNTYVGVYSTFHNVAAEEIARFGIKKVDWKQVEQRVIKESIGEHGQSPQDVYHIIAGFSPGTISFKQRQSIRKDIETSAPKYQALYAHNHANRRKDLENSQD